MIDHDFVDQIRRNLQYWQAKAATLSDETGAAFAPELPGVLRAIRYGLDLPQTAVATAELVAETYDFVDRFHYWEIWLPVLQAAWELPDLPPPLRGTLGIQLGRLAYELRRLEDAEAVLRQTLTFAAAAGLTEPVSAANYHLANLALERHQFNEARQFAATAGELFGRHHKDEPRKMGAILSLQGRIAQATGDDENAVTFLVAALPYWLQAGDTLLALYNYKNLGISYSNLNRPEEALETYAQASKLAQQTQNDLEHAAINLNRGTVFYRLERWAEAEACYRAALTPTVLDSDYELLIGAVLTSLASVLVEQNRGDEADPYLEQALPLWRRLTHRTMLANGLIVQGKRELLRGAGTAAGEYLAEALAILAEVPEDGWGQRLTGIAQAALAEAKK